MDSKKINEFKESNKIEGFYLLKEVECRTSSNGKKYMDFVISDKTGEINAKLWEYTEGDENIYVENILVKIRGAVTQWQGGLQLKIEKIRKIAKEDGIRVEDYVPSAPFTSEEMYDLLVKYINNIRDEELNILVSYIIENNKGKLMNYPAAKKNHHSVKSGLLYHTTTMLRAGEKLADIYDFLNRDLLYSGVILHDMAKLDEMEADDLGLVKSYTVEGQLLGHITQGVKMIEMAAVNLNISKEKTILLEHMILSHHYEPEYGSPVKPLIPEAEMLHYLDIIDARMFDMLKASESAETGNFSDKVWSLENRKIYKPKL